LLLQQVSVQKPLTQLKLRLARSALIPIVALLAQSTAGKVSVGIAQGLGFVETRGISDERRFRCANPEADFGLLDREASRDLASVRSQFSGGIDPLRGQAPRELRGPAYFHALLRAKLDRLLQDVVPELNRKLYAERPEDPFMLRCEVRYLQRKAREEPWAQTLVEDLADDWTEIIPRLARVAGHDRNLQAPASYPRIRRSYVTLRDYKPMDCMDVVSKAMKEDSETEHDDSSRLGGMSGYVGVSTDTDLALLILRAPKVEDGSAGFSAPYVLGMAITYAGRVKVSYFAFDQTSFAKMRFQLTANGAQTITWPWEDPLADEKPDEQRQKSAQIKVQGVEVTCIPAPCDPDRHTADTPP
jgi:hypothetical protein